MMKVSIAKSPSDPRSYVKQVPLPIPSQKGVPIQARVLSALPGHTDTVYNPKTPTREEVWSDNYKRRRVQWTSQGFRALNYKPYQGIGDPFYLDNKKLILNALGQWNENYVPKESETQSSSDEDDQLKIPPKPMTPAKFVLRRTRKDINTLPKEIAKARNLIRNVKLGHNFFASLRKGDLDKRTRDDREQQQKLDKQRREMQAPRYDSSSDEEVRDIDDELCKEVDLKIFMQNDDDKHSSADDNDHQELPVKISRVAFSRVDSPEDGTLSRAKSAPQPRVASRMSRQKKFKNARPYTPNHTNISTAQDRPEIEEDIQAESLFKQLCVLHWLLQAMNLQPHAAMGPILTCWDLKDIGGKKTTQKKLQKEKQSIEQGEQFLSTLNKSPKTPRRMSQRGNKMQRRFSKKRSGSISGGHTPSVPSPASSMQHLNNLPSGKDSDRKADDMSSIAEESDQGSIKGLKQDDNSSIEKNNNKIQEDTIKEEEPAEVLTVEHQNETAQEEKTDALPQFQSYFKDEKKSCAKIDNQLRKELRNMDISKQLDILMREEEMQEQREYIQRKNDKIDNKVDRRSLRADLHFIRSKRKISALVYWTPDILEIVLNCAEVEEFKRGAKSVTLMQLAPDLRRQFTELKEEKALNLHDKLDIIERQRLKKCEKKFTAMDTKGCSFYRALEKMRKTIQEEERRKAQLQRKQSMIFESWFNDLERNLPVELKSLWYYTVVLNKLRKFGQVDSAKQHNAYKFLTVLQGLRQWEICSPDISAAVEFCRDRIIEMEIDEYEEWFQTSFTQVVRPKTAPPSLNRKK